MPGVSAGAWQSRRTRGGGSLADDWAAEAAGVRRRGALLPRSFEILRRTLPDSARHESGRPTSTRPPRRGTIPGWFRGCLTHGLMPGAPGWLREYSRGIIFGRQTFGGSDIRGQVIFEGTNAKGNHRGLGVPRAAGFVGERPRGGGSSGARGGAWVTGGAETSGPRTPRGSWAAPSGSGLSGGQGESPARFGDGPTLKAGVHPGGEGASAPFPGDQGRKGQQAGRRGTRVRVGLRGGRIPGRFGTLPGRVSGGSANWAIFRGDFRKILRRN